MSTILLVDDRPENLRALEAVLEPLGHTLISASSGEDALACLLKEDISLILLDVMMPGLDGFETAELIKQRDRTSEVPIIFLTAINQAIEHHLRGYEAGAVDYISKPFDTHILRSKVSVFLDLHEKRTLLRAQKEELQKRLDERDRAQRALARRTAELTRSNTDLEQFVQTATHEMQEPLDTIAGLLDLVRARSAGSADEELHLFVGRAIAQVERMRGAMDELLQTSRLSDTLEDVGVVDMDEVVDHAAKDLETALADHGGVVTRRSLPRVRGDFWQLVELVELLVADALGSRGEDVPQIRIEATQGPDEHLIVVRHNGRGIDPIDAARLFTAIGRANASETDRARSVALATGRRIVERHGGRIWVEPSGGGGSVCFTLPAGER
jgi:two-component system, sensor histidine kinase and response regulator